MRLQTKYEWCIEVMDGEDIVDNHFEDTLAELESSLTDGELVLCRVEGNEVEGATDTLWAYVVDGKLPEYFSNSNQQATNFIMNY